MPDTSLPIELWTYIAEYLDRLSLRSLSLVDHYFRSTAAALLFNAISIQPLQATRLEQFLQRTTYNKHVRTLEIYFYLKPTLHNDDTFDKPQGVWLSAASDLSAETAYAEVLSWEPVAALVRSLPALTDLIWTCSRQFPACLLRILHDNKRFASCRLHIRTFRLPSLSLEEETVDPYELELVQSPNLHSIWFHYDEYHITHGHLQLPEAVMTAARGVAPNLRVIRLKPKLIMYMMTPTAPSPPPERVRRFADVLPQQQRSRGMLEEMQFTGVSKDLQAAQILAWAECTDFSFLRTLVIDKILENEALAVLASCRFTNLRALSLYLTIEPAYMPPVESRVEDTTSALARDFLLSLPALKKLRFSGELNHDYLHDVLAHHGSHLRTVELKPASGHSPHRLSLPPQSITHLAHHCLLLETLTVQMLRTRGDHNEITAYTSLGRIPRLQTLSLRLDASDYTALRNDEDIEPPDREPGAPWIFLPAPAKEHFDAFERDSAGLREECGGHPLGPRKGHVIDMFFNGALDEGLVRAIFGKLIDGKGERSLPFERVEIRSLGIGDFGMGQKVEGIERVAGEIQGRWIVERDFKTGDYGFRGLKEDPKKAGDEDDGEGEMDERVEVIFRRLWPEGNDWRKDWRSVPLAG